MKNKLTQKSLFQLLENVIPSIPDHRGQHRTTHSLRDAIFVIFSAAIRNTKKICLGQIFFVFRIAELSDSVVDSNQLIS